MTLKINVRKVFLFIKSSTEALNGYCYGYECKKRERTKSIYRLLPSIGMLLIACTSECGSIQYTINIAMLNDGYGLAGYFVNIKF